MNNQDTTRREFLKEVGLGAAAVAAATAAGTRRTRAYARTENDEKPNIIFICTDYQSGEDGPSLGSPFLDMPGLDRLCKNGVVFDRHYSTAPVCMPERYTWMTGQYPHTHGKWGNGGGWVKPGTPLLPVELAKHGYYTLGIGKMHFSPWEEMAGFNRRITADRKANFAGDAKHQDDYAKFLAKHNLTRWDYLNLCFESETPHVYDWPFPEECHIDHYVGNQAYEAIESGELDDKGPWLMWVSFNGPHNPWDPPEKYSKPYLEMDLPKPRTYPGELDSSPLMHTRARYGYTKEVADHIDHYPEQADAYVKKLRACHYGNLTLIDRQVEKIIGALEKKGDLDKTIIIYSADHGSLLGDHGSFHKGFIYERSANVPFVVHCPARYKPRRSNALSGGVDLAATILSLTGAPIPEAMEGRDLTPLFSGEKDSIYDEIIIELGHNIGVVTDHWKIYCHQNGEGELYDFKNDPDELKNLYNDPEYTKIREDLRSRLIAFRPEFAENLSVTAPKRIEEKTEYRFKQGDVFKQGREPYPPPQAGKSIHLRAVIEPSGAEPFEGAVFVCDEMIPTWPGNPPLHGYSLYIKDRKPAIGVRHWEEDTVVTSAETLPEGRVTLEAFLAKEGGVVLKVNGETVASGKTPVCLPPRPGRKETLAPFVHVGAGHNWGEAIGDYDKKQDFSGKIIGDVILTLS